MSVPVDRSQFSGSAAAARAGRLGYAGVPPGGPAQRSGQAEQPAQLPGAQHPRELGPDVSPAASIGQALGVHSRCHGEPGEGMKTVLANRSMVAVSGSVMVKRIRPG